MNSINNCEMIIRETISLEMSQLLAYEDEPEKVCILLPELMSKGAFDIGIIAYCIRGMSSKPNNTTLQPVCLSSFRNERQHFLNLLFDHLITKKWRDSTTLAFMRCVRNIVNWADNNNHKNLFLTPAFFRDAYFNFTKDLNNRVYHKKLKPISANQSQRTMKDMALINFGENIGIQIVSGISTIKYEEPDLDAPEITLVKENKSIFLAIAEGYGRAVLEIQPYPWRLQMPGYQTFVFPAQYSIKTPFTTNHIALYHYEDGRLFTAEELNKVNNRAKHHNNSDIKKSQINIDKHNALGLNSRYRMFDASMALTAYLQLFMLMTGIYGTEARRILYDNSIDIEQNITFQSFKSVKFRAGGKIVKYNLGSQHGLKILKSYLTFREFVLQGKECEFLFFRMNTDGVPAPHTDASIAALVTRARKYFFSPSVQIVRSRQARKFKNITLIEEKIGTKTASASLNHTERTNKIYYTPSSPDTSKRELSTLWSAIKKAANEIKITPDKTERDVSIPTGHCSNIGSPERAQETTPIEPDCKKQFGCLFCSKYIIHADHDDIHKLLSVRYVIEKVLRMSTDPEKSEKLLRELCVRIDYLIERLKKFSNATKKMIHKLYVDVFEYGDLTTFWSFRLERYAEMGMIL
ncbi:hypothetical protein K3H50_03735 [Aeromonas veronii]|nr:hypothetical protein [Aeromonas veronii]MCF5862473.1 hypothetical protein [Aeromonas veronii]